MADAKYVRVKTAFVSDLNSTESSVPVLNEYALTAGKTKIWNTLTDWEKGTFEGAAISPVTFTATMPRILPTTAPSVT